MTWRKSSRSGTDGNCVEVRGDLQALRDSKEPTAVMPVGPAAVAHLVTGITGGRLRPATRR